MRNFNYILWRQSDSPASDDVIMIDGEEACETERQEAFNYLITGLQPEIDGKQHVWNEKDIKGKLKKFESKTGEKPSPFISIYTDNFSPRHLLIKSHYNNVDNVGRRIAFMFCTLIPSSMDLKDVVKPLQDASKKINMDCNIADLHFIEKELKIKKNNIYKFFILVISFIILIFITIWIIKDYN